MFKIKKEDNEARTGYLNTAHGRLKTPFFMPVGTKANVKNISPEELKEMGTECLISNAFILSLKPGSKLIEEFGGIHKFMNWDRGIFTDSGGFQVLLDDFFVKYSDEGVKFKDPINGKSGWFRPEDSVKVQNQLGSDVAMAFDHVPHHDDKKSDVKASMNRTHDWAGRCLKAHKNDKQMMFGIIQGGIFEDLRSESAKFIDGLNFDGVAFGGLCIGEDRKKTYEMIKAGMKNIDKEKPKYVMGMGTPEEILNSISMGADIFDSIFPAQNARRGSLFTGDGQIRLDRGKFIDENAPIEEGCKCYTCKNFSKAYVNFMLNSRENFGLRLATIHNLYFLQNMIKEARKEIEKGSFEEYRQEFLTRYLNKKE